MQVVAQERQDIFLVPESIQSDCIDVPKCCLYLRLSRQTPARKDPLWCLRHGVVRAVK